MAKKTYIASFESAIGVVLFIDEDGGVSNDPIFMPLKKAEKAMRLFMASKAARDYNKENRVCPSVYQV